MYIGIKDGHIIIFGETENDVALNATIRNVTLDAIEETEEKIVPYYNTQNDGYYFKQSEVPPTPVALLNEQARDKRRILYTEQSDPITNKISVLRDILDMGDFADDSEKQSIIDEINELYQQRKSIRDKIAQQCPLAEEISEN